MEISAFKESNQSKDWFKDIVTKDNKVIVYTSYMNIDILKEIPDLLEDKQVLVHYYASLCLNNYVTKINDPEILLEEEIEDINLDKLVFGVSELQKTCNSNILENIFFEIHDGENKVTNLSEKYPEINKKMTELYEEFGFDLIHAQLKIN